MCTEWQNLILSSIIKFIARSHLWETSYRWNSFITCVQCFDKTVDVFYSIRFPIVFDILFVFFWHVHCLGGVERNTGFQYMYVKSLRKCKTYSIFFAKNLKCQCPFTLLTFHLIHNVNTTLLSSPSAMPLGSRNRIFQNTPTTARTNDKWWWVGGGGVEGGGDGQGNLPDRLQFVPYRVVFL